VTATRPGGEQARRLTVRLVELIDGDRLSVAAAAAATGVSVELASALVRLWAVETEAAETELDERLEDIERQCPGEDWWSYGERQLGLILSGSAIPNRIVRELVESWQRRTGQSTSRLAALLEIGDEALRRQLGMIATPGRLRNGQRGRPRERKTITVHAAGRIVRALGIPPCEVPGL
jgi:hypothetical protein